MKKIFLLLAFMYSLVGLSQSINEYQYVLVPNKFSIFKTEDRFRMNTLTKMVLEKYGFKTFMQAEAPTELLNNRCKALIAELEEDNGMMVTKVKIVLKDCNNKTIYQTDFGTSREKEFQTAYAQALREASKSFETLNYSYTGTKQQPIVSETIDENEEKTTVEKPLALSSDNPEIFYFAQPIANGFQIVNNEPRVIMRLFKTSQNNVFIGVKGDEKGVVLVKNGKCFFEFYSEGKLISEPINIRF